MTRIVLPEAKLFKEVIDAIGNIADEVALLLTLDGLNIKALDVDQSSLIDVSLPKDMFLEYDVGEEVSIGVSINNLKKVLKHLKKGENLAIELEGDFVKFTIGAGGVVSRVFKFRNLDVPTPEIPEFNLEFKASAKLMAQAVKKVIEDIEAVGGSTQIKATPEAIVFKSIGAGKVEVRFAQGSLALISLDVQEPSESVYDTTKLVNVLGIAKVSDIVTLEFSSKNPLKAEFSIGTGRVVYLLAPFEV